MKTNAEVLQELFDSPEERESMLDTLAAEELVTRLVELRKELGISQEQVAEAMEVGQSAVSQFENSTEHHLSTLQRYARAVGRQLGFSILDGQTGGQTERLRGFSVDLEPLWQMARVSDLVLLSRCDEGDNPPCAGGRFRVSAKDRVA